MKKPGGSARQVKKTLGDLADELREQLAKAAAAKRLSPLLISRLTNALERLDKFEERRAKRQPKQTSPVDAEQMRKDIAARIEKLQKQRARSTQGE